MSELKIFSMFSGFGGLDMAVEEVTGGKVAYVADVCGDPKSKHWPHRTPCKSPCTILAHRYPDAPNLGDVAAIDYSTIDAVKIVCAGFPCQDVSTAGKRAGLKAGTRTGLWSEVVRAIRELQPRLVVLENVPGIFTAPADCDVESCPWCVGDGPDGYALHALDAVLADLAEIGFDADWTCVRASGVGAPHRRERWFLTSYPRGEHGHERWLTTPRQAASGRTLGELAGRGRTSAGLTLLPTPDASPAKYRLGGDSQQSRSLPAMAIRGELVLLPTPRAGDGEKGGPNQRGSSGDLMMPSAVMQNFGQYAAAIARWESVIGRPAPSPTEPTGKGGAHRLSPRFTEWMMGAPDGWITDVPGITRNEALRACGNGVVRQQAVAALRHLLTQERAA